jgi:WD40 repeat protein
MPILICEHHTLNDVPRQLDQRGFSSLSPNEKNIAISNLSTGVDIYSLESLRKTRGLADDMTAESNYPLSVEFLADGRFVTAGSHSGRVRIWDRESGGIFQTLEHDSKLIQTRILE